jgi:putative ABC transport system permease protein
VKEVEMQAVMRQAKANVRGNALQSAVILVTLFAAATVLTLALSTFRVAQGAYERLFERTKGAHLWLYLDPEQVSAEEAERVVGNLPGVVGITGVMRGLSSDLFLGEERLRGELLREWPDERYTAGRPLLVAGCAPQPGEMDVIVMDRNEAVDYEVAVGHTVELLTPDGKRPLTVVGLHVSTEICPYPHCSPIRHYLSPDLMEELAPPALFPEIGNLAVGLRLQDPAGVETVVKAVEEALPVDHWLDWRVIRDGSDGAIENQRIILLTFGVVAVLAAGFLIASTIGEAVRARTRQIGLLKAVGFTRGQLALIYLLEYLGLALVAGVAGLAAGGVAGSLILRPLTALFGETRVHIPLGITLISPLGTLLTAALFTLWPVRRAARLEAVAAIRTGAERPRRRMVSLPRASLPVAVGLNDALSRPVRSTLTALALAMAVFTATAGLIISATFQAILTDPALGALPDGDLFLDRTMHLPDAEVRRLIDALPDVTAYYVQVWGGWQFPGESDSYWAMFREGDLTAFRFPVVEGRMLNGTEEVVVAYNLAKERGLALGDRLTITLSDELFTFRIVGVYRESNNQGRMVILPFEARRRVQPDAAPYRYVLRLRPGADAQALAVELTAASRDQLDVTAPVDFQTPAWTVSARQMLVALTLVLVGIAVVGVFNTLWMGVQERKCELALLKAVGVTPRQLALSVLAGAAAVGLIGYAVGVPLGILGTQLLIDTVARSIGFGPLRSALDGVGTLLVLPGTVLVAMVGAWIPARSAGRMSVVDSLRYE